ncbi:MAG TPA: hypothetical protein ENL09_01770, partial [Bacteroidetes bacterium]|nr:hypothetical protein [Bacteroidota bacterium]
TTTGIMDINTNMNFYIGNYGTGNSYNFPGVIDEVRVYNRALTPAEIQQNYEAEK